MDIIWSERLAPRLCRADMRRGGGIGIDQRVRQRCAIGQPRGQGTDEHIAGSMGFAVGYGMPIDRKSLLIADRRQAALPVEPTTHFFGPPAPRVAD